MNPEGLQRHPDMSEVNACREMCGRYDIGSRTCDTILPT